MRVVFFCCGSSCRIVWCSQKVWHGHRPSLCPVFMLEFKLSMCFTERWMDLSLWLNSDGLGQSCCSFGAWFSVPRPRGIKLLTAVKHFHMCKGQVLCEKSDKYDDSILQLYKLFSKVFCWYKYLRQGPLIYLGKAIWLSTWNTERVKERHYSSQK